MMVTKSFAIKEHDLTNEKYKKLNPKQSNLNRFYVGKPKVTKEPESVVYSFKPQKYLLPKDVSVIEIMQTMKSNKSLRIKNTDLRLTAREKKQRSIYIEKLKLFIVCENFTYALVSYSIYLMDILISRNSPIPIEHIFLGSMLLGIKFYSTHTRLLLLRRVQKFMKDTCRTVYTIEQLNQIELKCLILLEYKLNWVHAIHFIQLLGMNGILFNIDISNKSDSINSNIYDLIYTIIDTLYEGDKYFSQDSFHLACACVAVAREICGFTPWSSVLNKVFGINLYQFNYCFDFVKEFYTGQKQNQNQSPQKQHYEKKIIPSSSSSSSSKPKQKEANSDSVAKSEPKEIKHKYIYNKSKSLEINKDQIEDFLYTQRNICYKPKVLSIIKENDINSTKDNSFGIMTEMNLNKTNHYNKEINAYNNHSRPGVISLHNSSNSIVKKLDFNKIEEDPFIQRYKKPQVRQSDDQIAYTARAKKQCNRSDVEEEEAEEAEEVKKPNKISLIKHIQNKGVSSNANDKGYVTGIKRLLRENKNTNLFDNFEVVKKSDRTFCASNHKK